MCSKDGLFDASRNKENNALVFYGGGLCDCATFYIATLARELSRKHLFKEVYVGFYSFRCLTTTAEDNLLRVWDDELNEELSSVKDGGYIGTARKTDLTDPKLQKKAIETCKKHGISWVFVAGGDGSARQTSEISKAFEAEGIKFCFTMPMTIDGIEGGKSHGLIAARDISLKIMDSICSTALRTLDGNKYPGILFEVQGRNRDDILAHILSKIQSDAKACERHTFSDAQIIAIPANTPWSEENLRRKLHIEDDVTSEKIIGKPTVILMSEGASVKKRNLVKIAEEEGMKLRTFSIGHLSQVNGMTSDAEKRIIKHEICCSVTIIEKHIADNKSFTIVFDGSPSVDETYSFKYSLMSMGIDKVDYFAKRNPREGQVATLGKYLQEVVEKFLP